MKNVIYLVLLTLIGCQQKTKQPIACTEFNANCEILKEWCLIKPLSLIDTNSMDALGQKLIVGEWYIRNGRTRVLLPFQDGIGNETGFTHQNLSKVGLASQFINVSKNLQAAKIDTLGRLYDENTGERNYLISAEILCTTGGEVALITLQNSPGYAVGWINYQTAQK